MGSTRDRRSHTSLAAALLAGIAAGLAGLGPVARGEGASAPASPTELINASIAEGWAQLGVRPAASAEDSEFLRRAYLDIIGRIPSAEDTSAFLASKAPSKRAKLIDILLAHPDYPKNFGTIWTNLLVGRDPQDDRVQREALAAWLRRRFADERPWDETVRELVTAAGSSRENGAVNFTLAHLDDGAVNLTSYTTRLFLGQQIQCTQCHDHFENSWKQADFWSINAFFNGVRTRDLFEVDAAGARVRVATEVRDEPTDGFSSFERRNAMMGIAYPRFLDGRTVGKGPEVQRRAELARFLTEPENPQLAKAFVNRTWGHFMGRGFVNPVDDFGDHNEPSHPALLDGLAEAFQESGYDVKALIRWIATSTPYQLSSKRPSGNATDESLFTHMLLKPMTPEQLFDSLLTATDAHKAGPGDADARREQWLRQFVFTFGNDEGQESNVFQGTIPQALLMMNGELIAEATSGKPGSFLAKVRDRSLGRPGRQAEYLVTSLYLSALNRKPSRDELAQAVRLLQGDPDPMTVVEDLFWALLNSNEFVLNH